MNWRRSRGKIWYTRSKRCSWIQPKGRSSKLLIKLIWISLTYSRTNHWMARTSPRLNMISSLSLLFHSKLRILSYIILVTVSSGIWWYFTDTRSMLGNYGKIHTYIDVGLSIIMIVGFPLFLVALSHKGMLFWNTKQQTKKISQLQEKTSFSKTNILGTLGGTIGTILSWSSCCGLTLASYFGLIPLMNILPYSGLEIKILGTLGLLYALYDILKNLETCTWKKK